MVNLPIFTELEKAERILIAGCGGGFDVFGGLPLYFGLKAMGKTVYLASLSFTILPFQLGQGESTPSMLKVTADTKRFDPYFPEKYLCDWFKQQENQDIPIYCFDRTGVKPLLVNYQQLVTELELDTIILADGGTDSLMRGDEDGLGTPTEDMMSIAAVNELAIERKILLSVGFGVDHYHGVSNYLSLEAIASLTEQGGFLGSFSLMRGMPEVEKYYAATNYVFERMPHDISIVSTSILAALDGHYGNYHSNSRTYGSRLWINPLMAICWCFNLNHIAKRVLYLPHLMETETMRDVRLEIQNFRQSYKGGIRKRGSIPD